MQFFSLQATCSFAVWEDLIFKSVFILFHVYEYFLSKKVCVCTTCMTPTCSNQKRASDLLELEL